MMINMLRTQPRAVGAQPVNHVPAKIPRAGMVTSTVLTLLAISILAICFSRRIPSSKDWSKLPLTRWLILIIYADSILFIFISAILQHGFGLNLNMEICSSAILICLACYMTTKLIYYFLVEKVYIIRSVSKPRLKSKLYLFNCFGMLLLYVGCVALNFVYRTAYFTKAGTCVIGMEMKAMMPLIIFDAVVNLYLTLLFVLPLRSLYSYQNSPNSSLRAIALRSFVGSISTLISSVVNLTVLMVLKGEEAWICLMLCNADILFSVIVLHWVTSKDTIGGSISTATNLTSRPLESRSRRQQRRDSQKIDDRQNVFTEPCQVVPEQVESFDFFGESGLGIGSVTTHISAEKSRAVLDSWQQSDQGISDQETEGRGKNGKSLRSTKSLRSLKSYKSNRSLKSSMSGQVSHSRSGSANHPLGWVQVEVGQTVETVTSATSASDRECELISDFRFSSFTHTHPNLAI